MPIYEYRCRSCGQVTEVIQKMGDPPLATCDGCAGTLEKLVSRTSFQLSGSGWFSSGYSKGSGASPKESPGASDAPKGDGPSDGATKKAAGGCGSGCGCH